MKLFTNIKSSSINPDLAFEHYYFILLSGYIRQHLPDPMAYLDSCVVLLTERPLVLIQAIQLHPIPAEPCVLHPLLHTSWQKTHQVGS